jgi:hypothetical protein
MPSPLRPALLGLLLFACRAGAAELILPQNRTAFYADEAVEVAVAGLKNGEPTRLEFVPAGKGLRPVSFPVVGDGSTVVARVPAGTLAPAAYRLRLGGKDAGALTVSSGVNVSPLGLSATVGNPKTAGANFLVGNAFSFGLLDPQGRPALDVRRRSAGMQAFDNAVRDNLPTLVYMYWTGYVTHKPFGSEKSWAAADMREATRLLSFHTAQRLRRYRRNILSVGTLDEPGLSWGKTPAGGMASGFPNWDEQAYYARHGWKYTPDPGSRPADDWMRYMTARCDIIKSVNAQAKEDLKAVWPGVVFSTDLYAPQAVMDGTDPLNQQVNDIPSSHVFLDWGVGKLGALSGLYLEKAHAPQAKIAHAMNGQLFGKTVPQPQQGDAYRLMLNSMLASGLASNWWLNPTGMTNADLARVNEPALRLGGLFAAFAPKDHDVAVLWSFTEVCMREKDVTAREAKKKTGEQIKLMIASLPDVPGAKDKSVAVNAYNVGGNYKEQVLSAHQALARAGYPAHIVHERILTPELLKRYKTLVVVGQTFDLPAGVKKVIDDWSREGGTVVVDGTTRVKFPGAVRTGADFRDPAFRWGAFFGEAEKEKHPFKSNREASVYQTNWFMDEPVRKAVRPMKEAMAKTKSRPAVRTDSAHLAAEKHTAGDAALYLVINAHDRLPDGPPGQRHWLYNYAPLEATFTLEGIRPGSRVVCLEGPDWKTVREVKDYDKPQKASFAPGEMKLYLVWPGKGGTTGIKAKWAGNRLEAATVADHPAGPEPLTVRVKAADGSVLYQVHRATPAGRAYAESFPLGGNRADGPYELTVESLGRTWSAKVSPTPDRPSLGVLADRVRVFDEKALRAFLKGKPGVVIAAGEAHKEQAAELASALTAAGVKATVKPASAVLRKVAYPRVWNPFALVYTPTGKETRPAGYAVKTRLTVGVDASGKLTARTAEGKDVSADWRLPNSEATVAGDGYVDFGGDQERCYAAGVKLYFDAARKLTVLNARPKEEKTTAAFRVRWSRPWSHLTTHVGGYQLPPALPEAWTTDSHLVLLGDSTTSAAVRALQAGEVLPQAADGPYPGPGKALVQLAWSPFAVGKNVVLVGASDAEGLRAGAARLVRLAR